MKKLSYVVLPSWLAENLLFQFLFLIRKLFLTRLSSRFYSQFAEDVAVANLFKRQKRGFFVDVGCYHPIKYNNTWRLYKKGWRGVNVDLDSIKILGFRLLRWGDENVCSAVSTRPGAIDLYTNGIYSLTSSVSAEFANSRGGYQRRQVRSRTLTEILDASRFNGRRIDFLSVDVEGADLDVLNSLDFDRYQPRVIAVESHLLDIDSVTEDPIYRRLADMGYRLIGWSGLTLIFGEPEMLDVKRSAYL